MASSKVMASTSPPNPDLPRQTSPSSLLPITDQNRNFGSMSMEEILKNIYSDPDSFVMENNGVGGGDTVMDGVDAGGGRRNGSGGGDGDGDGNRTVDDVWRDIVIGGGNGGGEPAMTLEDFLTKAGAVSEEDLRVPMVTMAPSPVPPATAAFGVDATVNSVVGVEAAGQFAPAVCMRNGGGYGPEFGNGMVAVGRSGGGSGRGKRRAPVEEVVLDKATQQKQRRMIKNRESAARSRERKQAYTVELETLVTQLEEENARLLREEAEQNRKRYKQLMENLIPVDEGKRPPRVLRRVQSMNL